MANCVMTLVQIERERAEKRFPAYQRSLDWDELWRAYASILGDERPAMAYVRDFDTQRISPVCNNLSR
jgi:hypothetical protein